ncbi:MAG TPA: M17 family peptidase N-terminal domain-containing protein, partial [Gammaproteobacteria bacterium]|nr:M17 family peptidase N-terminal domain-containing protein [Gammaproteobacteria bacterium]
MKFKLTTTSIVKQQADCIMIGVFEKAELTSAAKQLDKLSQHYLEKLLKKGDFEGKTGETLLLHQVPHIHASRVLLVGCGKKEALTAMNYRKLIACGIRALMTTKITDVSFFLTELDVQQHDLSWKVKQAALVTANTLYRFDRFKSEKIPALSLQALAIDLPDAKKLQTAEKALKQAVSIIDGMELTKNLANLPSNICTPSYLATQAKALAKQYKAISVKILEEKDMRKLGMGAFLAVTQGSAEDAKLVCLEYKGTSKKEAKEAPIALVGKGITFDTGGLSLKPADSMVGMKYDMCGTATVLGTLKAAAELKLPIHLVGILAIAENMPSGTAVKP